MSNKKSDRQLIINASLSETRVALLEGGRVAELYMERARDRAMVGNIYKGTVMRVLPGMQSAFINIGADRTAFLYGGDVFDPAYQAELDALRASHAAAGTEFDYEEFESQRRKHLQRTPIEKLIREGQEIAVQVAKEPLGTKGARVTMFLSIPGRFLVLMPELKHVGISRRIEDPAEKARLKLLVDEIVGDQNVGIIVRTAAAGVNAQLLQKDLKYLLKVWEGVDTKRGKQSAPSVLYQDLDLAQRTTRDLYSEDVEKIAVDNREVHDRMKAFLTTAIPGAAKKLEFYEKKTPIFDEFGVEIDIGRALNKRIELPSGGYLIIDQTEALTSFDVNTGKFVGQLSAQDTILRTNLEAVVKVVAQLRIRNIGGIIVIDFIDMERGEDREKVFNAFLEELKTDKAKTNVLRISELGLVQMTRKRTSESLERELMEPCPYCDGRGRIRSTVTEAYDLIRELQRHSLQTGKKQIKVRARDDIRHWMEREDAAWFATLAQDWGITVEFEKATISLELLQEAPYEIVD